MKSSKQRPSVTRRQLLRTAATATAAAGAAQFGLAKPPHAPETIFWNGKLLTQDPSRPSASAMAISDGLLTAVGGDRETLALRDEKTEIIDLKGHTVIPGLNDSHMHPTRAGRFYALELRWDGVRSLKKALAMVADQAKRTPKGEWVRVVGGWSPYQFEEQRLPTPAELTRAAPNTPTFVLFLYSRGFLNRAAVNALGLGPEAVAPEGTRYEFTADGGAILHAEPNPDLLYGTIARLPQLNADQQRLSTTHFYRELNRFGLTSVIDAGGGGHRYPDNYGATLALAEDRQLPLRISKYLFPQNKGREYAEFQQWMQQVEPGDETLSNLMHGYHLSGAGEFLVWAAGDYENFLAPAPDITSRPEWRSQLLRVTRLLLQAQWPLRIHATYDASVNAILDVFEQAHALEVAEHRAGFSGIRFVVDHGETLQISTIKRLRMLGAGVAMQSRMAYAGEYFLERYGKAATRRAPPLREVLASGIPLGLGSDATRVASYNPWVTLAWATTGRSVGGTPLHGPEQRLSRSEALYCHTVGSAWISGEERLKGRLRAGQFADFAVLNAPYLSVADADLPLIESALTVVGGEAVYSDGSLTPPLKPFAPLDPDWLPVNTYGGYQT
ncbi:amidohydrolase 3 [Luminiphilus syltensis NOR5-1B]|uniref:Amidohydrolase 3 n=1 Tax=Luminiphilus syltensis NOR5-1B TaxID=565045 RepID=B8KRC0_9GAMM|nr:amidohydrolase [Luminiphilus syltensis]EED35986.1 amidohydrolase 3 [Luminiphilus syltensis NOR5-1B]